MLLRKHSSGAVAEALRKIDHALFGRGTPTACVYRSSFVEDKRIYSVGWKSISFRALAARLMSPHARARATNDAVWKRGQGRPK